MRPDKPRPTGDKHSHAKTSCLLRSCLKYAALSWNNCCQSSKERNPQSLRPNLGSRLKPANTFRLSTNSRPKACGEEKRSPTNSLTIPSSVNHSCNGTGKPILSLRLAMDEGKAVRRAALSTCFISPSLNLILEGMVAASSTSG